MARSQRTWLSTWLWAAAVLCACRGEAPDAQQFLQRWQAAYNSHDIPSFTALYAEAGHFRVPPMLFPANSRAELADRLRKQWFASPGARVEGIGDVVAQGNRLAFSWRFVRQSSAPNAPAELVGASFLTVERGKIVQHVSVMGRPVVLPPAAAQPQKPPAQKPAG